MNNKLAPPPEAISQRQITPQAARSFGQPRPISRLSAAHPSGLCSTRAQVEWRAKMVHDMAVGMELEIRTNLAGSMLEAERCETFRALMAANALSRGDSWCSDDLTHPT